MLNRKNNYGQILIIAIVVTFAIPAISNGKNLGHDWYCSDPETHAQYEKHLKLHIDHGAEAIAEALGKIHTDPSLTAEEKYAETVSILKKHLSTVKPGAGVGD